MDAAVTTAGPTASQRRGLGGLRDVSWTGMAGGVAGFLPFAAIAVLIAASPPSAGAWPALIFAAVAATFLPAIWVSAKPLPARQTVLRAETGWSLLLAFAGVLLFGIGFALLMVAPTSLLAIAAGLIFQPARQAERRK